MLKRAALESALSVTPHQLRVWVRDLTPFANRTTKERCANEYSLADLAFLFVVKMLTEAGFGIDKIKPISEDLYKAILRPVSAGHRQSVRLHERGGWSITSKTDGQSVSIEVPIWKAWDSVNQISDADVTPRQGEMKLGVTDISRRPRATGRRA